MSHFTDAEIAYMRSQRLGRLATIGKNGEPHVVPVRFRYDAETDTISVGGRFFGQSKKFRDAIGNPRVAFVIDDVPAPGQPRGLEVRGRAEVIMSGGQEIMPGFDPEFVRIWPTRIVSWGIDTDAHHPQSRVVTMRGEPYRR